MASECGDFRYSRIVWRFLFLGAMAEDPAYAILVFRVVPPAVQPQMLVNPFDGGLGLGPTCCKYAMAVHIQFELV